MDVEGRGEGGAGREGGGRVREGKGIRDNVTADLVH